VYVIKVLVSDFFRCGDQRQHGISHDSGYSHAETYSGDTFAAVQDDLSTTFPITDPRGNGSSSKPLVIPSVETDFDFWLDPPDLPALEPINAELLDHNTINHMPQSFQLDYDDGQTFIDEGATNLYWNNPIQPDHT